MAQEQLHINISKFSRIPDSRNIESKGSKALKLVYQSQAN